MRAIFIENLPVIFYLLLLARGRGTPTRNWGAGVNDFSGSQASAFPGFFGAFRRLCDGRDRAPSAALVSTGQAKTAATLTGGNPSAGQRRDDKG